ncbi:MAG: hypothetical protein ABIK07_26380 [Planctomycetota bacterium]|jgi:hypothetical protein|uniref:hypothetical protein n=1 Tax=uncultured Gimesia sp. TaxID=1678688 RepID=UPI002634912E|nr:hypothetical protein [uncultured Gimesia sp.]
MNEQSDQQKKITIGARLVGAVIGCVFAGIGLTVLGALWSGALAAPFLFRIFGSFVAIPFMAIGGFTAYSAITGLGLQKSNLVNSASVSTKQGSYSCPNCNAPLSDEFDVSPHGDVKCEHCNGWFNIHHA